MRILKRFLLIFLILNISLTLGCSNNTDTTEYIKIPVNKNLIIKGSWKIDNIKILDEEIENKSEILKLNGSLINISEDEIVIFNKIYKEPNYKLKVVNTDYILSYEFNIEVGDLINNNKEIDIISIINSNRILGEFIIINNNEGYLVYSGILLKLSKSNDKPTNIDNNKNAVEAEIESEEYNSDVGVLLGLKSKRKINSNGEYELPKYRTLWISLKDNKMQPIIEKDNIIFPRINGIWEIDNNKEFIDGNNFEYFTLKYLDRNYIYENNDMLYSIGVDIYKDINFVSNDYISMEMYIGESFNNKFNIYQTIPIDDINTLFGLSIGNLYSKEIQDIYEEKYINILKDEYYYRYKEDDYLIDNTNFTLKRLDGRWRIVGKVTSKYYNDNGKDFTIPISQNKKILNYDTLLISWKDLKSKFPFIEDAYTAPTGKIALIIFDNKLLIYEMKDKAIKGNPLEIINLSEDEEVIMAEWASGTYVDLWSKNFKDGNILNKKEE